MKLKSDINLNLAFEMLKEALRDAEILRKEDTETPGANFVKAYSKLSAVTETVLHYVEDRTGENDIEGVLDGPGTSK